MSSFFLHTKAFKSSLIISAITDLIDIPFQNNDLRFKNKAIYDTDAYLELVSTTSQDAYFLTTAIESFNRYHLDLANEHDLINQFSEDSAFVSLDFTDSQISTERCITNSNDYRNFKNIIATFIRANNFQTLKESAFPNLIFCDKSDSQIVEYGNGNKFSQVKEQLQLLNKAVQEYWVQKEFPLKTIKESTALDISPESKPTLQKYGHQRKFNRHDGGVEIFSLHLKLGSIRIHIFPDFNLKKVLIGYVGPHLSTVKYK